MSGATDKKELHDMRTEIEGLVTDIKTMHE
jgi:hypothetical protein